MKKICAGIVLITILMISTVCTNKQYEFKKIFENNIDNTIKSIYALSSILEITNIENGLSSVTF